MTPTDFPQLPHSAFADGLYAAVGSMALPRFAITVPAGTTGWAVSWQSYAAPGQLSRLLMRMDAPPVLEDAQPIGDTRDTLARLAAGETLLAISPGESGGLGVSAYESGRAFAMSQARTLYCEAIYPGGSLIRFESRLIVNPAYAAAPAPVATPLSIEARTLDYARRAGLVPALKHLARVDDDAGLVAAVANTGTWAALCEVVRIAEAEGAAQ